MASKKEKSKGPEITAELAKVVCDILTNCHGTPNEFLERCHGKRLIPGQLRSRKGPFLPCKPEHEEKIRELASQRLAEDQNLLQSCSSESYFYELQYCISDWLEVNPNSLPEEKEARDLFRNAATSVKRLFKSSKYFFPVYAIYTDHFPIILGPVRITPSHVFLEENRGALLESSAALSLKWKPAPEAFEKANQYYRQYPFIAEILVSDKEPKVAIKSGRSVIKASLNVFRLFFTSRSQRFIGLAGDCPYEEEESRFTADSDGRFYTSESWSVIQPSWGTGEGRWFGHLWPHVAMLDSLLTKAHAHTKLEPIEANILNALYWFGEAWEERDPAPKILKFTIALETICALESREGIADSVASRIAYLITENRNDRRRLFHSLKKLYSTRSRVAHGDVVSPDTPKIQKQIAFAEGITRDSIFSLIYIYAVLKSRKRNITDAMTEFWEMERFGFTEEEVERWMWTDETKSADPNHDLRE